MIASPDNTDPFLSKTPDNGMEVFSFSLLIFDVGMSPYAVFPALFGKLMEGLPKEVVTAHSPIDFMGFTALFSDRSHTGERSQSFGILTMWSKQGEGGQHARSNGLASPREGGKEFSLGGFAEAFPDDLIVVFDVFIEGLDLFDDGEQFHLPYLQQIGILGEGDRRILHRKAFLEAFGAAAAGGVEKADKGGFTAAFEGCRIGPLLEQSEVHFSMDVLVQQLQGLRIVLLEDGLQAVGQGGSLVHELAPGEVEHMQGPGLAVGFLVGVKGPVVALHKARDAGGVALVGVGARELEALTVIEDDGGIERVDFGVGQLPEEQLQVQRRLLEGHPDQTVAITLAQPNPPVLQDRRVGADFFFLDFLFCAPDAHRDRTVGSVHAQEQGLVFDWQLCFHLFILSFGFSARGGDGNRDGSGCLQASSEESFCLCFETDRGQVSFRSSRDITLGGSRSVLLNTLSLPEGNLVDNSSTLIPQFAIPSPMVWVTPIKR